MAHPSLGIKDLLVGAVPPIGQWETSNAAWPIYISKLPDKPDQCIAIYDTGGQAPDPKWLLDYPNVVVMVRAKTYIDARQKIQDIRSRILGLPSQDINGDRWVSITQMGDIVDAGHDEKDRQLLTATFRLIIEPAGDSYTNRLPL